METEKKSNGSTFNWRDEIKRIYYDVNEPGSYYGPTKLYQILKKRDPTCKLNDVKEWIRGQSTYNIHREKRYKFERRKLVRLRPYETLSADIVFFQDLSRYNSGYSYVLSVICLFSNKGWCFPLKRKTKAETADSLEPLFQEHEGEIVNLFVDRGVEFDLDSLYEKYDINKYSINSELKSMHVENFNKQIENRIYRALTATNSLRWLDILDGIVKSYNDTPSARLYGYTPNEALVSPQREILKKKFKEERETMVKKHEKRKNDIKAGMYVYVAKPKTLFARGYKAKYYDKPKKVIRVLSTAPRTFKIAGVKRSCYRWELAITQEPNLEEGKQKEEKGEETDDSDQLYFIVKERTSGGRVLRSQTTSGQEKEYLIKSHQDPDFENWISAKEIKKLHDGRLLSNGDIWL